MFTPLDPRPVDKIIDRITRTQRVAATIPVEVTSRGAAFLYGQIRRNLQGVPGMPQPETYAYMRSWRIQRASIGPLSALFFVVTSHPAANRLERGFQGTDSMGRVVSQAPRPHIAPAVVLTRKAFHEDMVRMNIRIWRQ